MRAYEFGISLRRTKKRHKRIKLITTNTNPDKYIPRTGVNFRFQIGRNQLKTFGSTFYSTGAHESRFELVKPCKILSSYHEHNIPNFDKTKSRDNLAFYCNMTLSDYNTKQPFTRPSCIFVFYCL